MKRFSSRGAISLTVAVALTVGGGVAASMFLVGSANAAVPKSDKCTKISGTAAGGITVSGCTSTTSASDPAEPGTTETNGSGTVTVSGNQSTTHFVAPYEGGETSVATSTQGTAETDTDTKGKCPTGTTEIEIKGTVNAGSDDATGKITGEVCLDSAGNVTAEKGSSFTTSEPKAPNS